MTHSNCHKRCVSDSEEFGFQQFWLKSINLTHDWKFLDFADGIDSINTCKYLTDTVRIKLGWLHAAQVKNICKAKSVVVMVVVKDTPLRYRKKGNTLLDLSPRLLDHKTSISHCPSLIFLK